MDIVDKIIKFIKRKFRVRRFRKYRELLEIAFEIVGEESTRNNQLKSLKDIIRICNESNYVGASAKSKLLILKYQYVDGISKSQLRAWGTPEELL